MSNPSTSVETTPRDGTENGLVSPEFQCRICAGFFFLISPNRPHPHICVSSPVLLLLVGDENFDNDDIGKAEAVAKKTTMTSDAHVRGGTINTTIKK